MAAFVGAKASYTASSLDNYQRLMMAGLTALRDKMSDVGASVVVKKDTMRSSPTRRSKPGAEVARLDDTQDTDAASEAHQWSPNKPSRSGSYQPSAQQSFAGGATEAASADVQDAAGYSELQAAFERTGRVAALWPVKWPPHCERAVALKLRSSQDCIPVCPRICDVGGGGCVQVRGVHQLACTMRLRAYASSWPIRSKLTTMSPH